MIPRAVLALTAVLALSAPARAAPAAAYDAKASPLDELSRDLLTGNGYEFREDGAVWDKISESAVPHAEMPNLLSRLAGARRLKALLELNLILNRSEGEKQLTDAERESVRTIVRRDWSVFGVGTRRDFRSYFSVQELEALDKIPPRFDKTSALPSLKDPEPESPTAGPPPPVPSPTAPAPVDPAIGVLKPWTPPAVSTAAAAAVSTAAASATAEAPVAAPPPPPPPELAKPSLPAVSAEQYDKFVDEGPYADEGKALLHLLGRKAPGYCLPLLRRTVLSAMPQIVLDGARTGAGLRAGLVVDAAKPDAPPVAALSPGAVYVERKRGLFGPRREILLPESPAFYAELGVPVPAIDALRKDAVPTVVENGPWGAAKVFADASRRGSYSSQEQAGELLEQLLLLGLRRERLDASAYAAKRWARTARLLFSAGLKDDVGHDGFLDPDRRAELREWLERPDEADDALLSSWAGSRLQVVDPRRGAPDGARAFESRARGSCVRTALEDALAEAAGRRARRVGALETLLDAGLAASSQAKAAAQAAADEEAEARKRLLAAPPACPAPDPGRDEALRKASLIADEALRAERSWRQKKAKGEAHEN